MLQDMQKKVTEEGKKEQELYDKFMCYCKTSGGALSASIADAEAKMESVSAEIKSGSEKKTLTEASLKNNQDSRAAANDAVSKATALRENEAAEYAKVKSDSEANIAAITKAVAALEKGMGGSFLQTPAAGLVRSYAMERAEISDSTRQELLSFLSGTEGSDYAPQSGEITGILKQIGDEMDKNYNDATTEENNAIANYEALMAAKKKEISALQAQIEEEMTRIGNLGVQLAAMNNDHEDTQEALAADQQFVKELEEGCKTKTAEWEADYEAMLADAGDKRAADAKSMTEKESAKADNEEALQAEKEKKTGTTKEAMAVGKYISSLHQECDWLLQYFEPRKSARSGEIESLVNAKAVLSGADYSLVQTVAAARTGRFMAPRV